MSLYLSVRCMSSENEIAVPWVAVQHETRFLNGWVRDSGEQNEE